ncbi:hypothetical protein BH18VER2_BH18VER2_02030 [soil metagenome]
MITGDFNGDGKLDLAVTQPFGGNTVAILLGKGNGSFQGPVHYPTGLTPGVLTTGDFDGDGKLDLAVPDEDCCTFSVKKVSILLGNGDGTFQPHVDYTVGSGPIGARTADFDGDGKLDLAVNNLNASTVSILLVDYPTEVQGDGGSVITDDFNGDGQLDLVTSNLDSGTISLLLGNWNGTFQSHVDYGMGSNPRIAAAGDFNGDGRRDIAVPNNGSTTVSVFLQGTIGALQLTSAASRETHGITGTFDVNLPLTGGGIEGRYGPSRQDLVFTFNSNVTGADSVTTSCGTAAQASVDPNDAHSLHVKLTALSCDQQFVTVTLNGVHDDQGNTLASASITFGSSTSEP